MQYFYNTNEMEKRPVGDGYTPAKGAYINGERIIFAQVTSPAGSVADSHHHPNEQFVIIIKGRGRYVVEDQVRHVGPGDIVHIPPNVIHSMTVDEGEDCVFITAKDTSWGIQGTKV